MVFLYTKRPFLNHRRIFLRTPAQLKRPIKNILRDNRRYALARRWLQRNADIKDIFQRPFCGVITAHAMYTSAWRRR